MCVSGRVLAALRHACHRHDLLTCSPTVTEHDEIRRMAEEDKRKRDDEERKRRGEQ